MPVRGQPTDEELAAFRARLERLAARAGGRKALWGAAGMSESNFSRLLGGKRQIRNPGVFTVKALAEAAGTSLAAVLGEEGREVELAVTPYETNPRYRMLIDELELVDADEREEIVRHALWETRRAHRSEAMPTLANVLQFPTAADDGGDFPLPPIPPDEWIEKDGDVPRALHAWIRPVDAEGAAGAPRNPDDTIIPAAQILNSLREVRDDRVKVVKIFGDSMYPILRNGWKVLLDPSRNLFAPGRIVMVYIKDEGTTVGMLAKAGDAFRIVKRNANYGGPTEIGLRPGEWYPIGTITTIVEAPVEIE